MSDRADAAPRTDIVEVAALRAAYDMEGQAREILFIDVPDAAPQDAQRIAAALHDALGVVVRPADEADRSDPDLPVLTPADPETGEAGIVLRLTRLTPVDGDTYSVSVDYARSGLDGGSLDLTLRRDTAEWTIVTVEHTSTAKAIG